MATKSFEDRLQHLEDIREIENLMAKYAYLYTGVSGRSSLFHILPSKWEQFYDFA